MKKEGKASVGSLMIDNALQSLQLQPSSHTGYSDILQKKAKENLTGEVLDFIGCSIVDSISSYLKNKYHHSRKSFYLGEGSACCTSNALMCPLPSPAIHSILVLVWEGWVEVESHIVEIECSSEN